VSADRPVWVPKRAVLALHGEQLRIHGGPEGLRDEGALESALARPQNLLAYGEPDLPELAAAYAFGLARNHAFVDGNKRISFVACLTFLRLNGHDLPTDDEGNIATWLALAAGTLSEADLATWLRARIRPLG
jgi:death on curing protein